MDEPTAGTGADTHVTVELTVNGRPVVAQVEARRLLVEFLREDLDLTGTHIGCETSYCGACTVLVDGDAVKSCTVLVASLDGRAVRTIEGLASGDDLHPVQIGFWAKHGLQCGFCTPGMIMSAVALLDADPRPDEATIRRAIEGNLCRCTGYQNIVDAIRSAAERIAGDGEEA